MTMMPRARFLAVPLMAFVTACASSAQTPADVEAAPRDASGAKDSSQGLGDVESSARPDIGISDPLPEDAGAVGLDAAPQDLGPARDTWTSYARGFAASYCVECHGPGNARRDYSSF